MKLPVPFIQLPLAFDAQVLAAEIQALGEDVWRPHPQGYPGNSALTLITTDGDPESDKVRGAMLPTPHLLHCPYLMQVLDSIGATWGRTRLMRLAGQAEVTPHVDINYYWREHVRVHVPILTQPTVRFHCGNAEVNMAAGECWIFDTWRLHRVINDAERPRIHLVADTVGGDGFWNLVSAGRTPDRPIAGWTPRMVAPRGDAMPKLDYESVNVPQVMTPWEMREHFAFLLGEAKPNPSLGQVQWQIMEFTRRWHALWACYGESSEGWPRYRELLNAFTQHLARGPKITLQNEMSFAQTVGAIVLANALADRESAAGREAR